MITNSQIGAHLKAAREWHNLSQEFVAQMMRMEGFNWNQSTVWKIEIGGRNLTLQEGQALSAGLGIDWNGGPGSGVDESAARNAAFVRIVERATRQLSTALVALDARDSVARMENDVEQVVS